MSPSELESLAELEAQLVENWTEVANNLWRRAVIYSRARYYFQADREFGEWLAAVSSRFRRAAKPEGNDLRAQMIWAARHLTQEQCEIIGFRACRALKRKKPWRLNPEAMHALISFATETEMGLRDIERAVDKIEKGLPWREEVEPEEPVVEYFLSTAPEMFALQKRLLGNDLDYALSFFNVTLEEALDPATLETAYKRLRRVYHPDRHAVHPTVATDENFQCVTETREFIDFSLEMRRLEIQTHDIINGRRGN